MLNHHPNWGISKYENTKHGCSCTANNIVSEDTLTPEPRPSMNSVLLRWTPSLNIHSKLKGQRKTIKFGSDTSLEPSLAPHSLSLNTILVTLSLSAVFYVQNYVRIYNAYILNLFLVISPFLIAKQVRYFFTCHPYLSCNKNFLKNCSEDPPAGFSRAHIRDMLYKLHLEKVRILPTLIVKKYISLV